MMLPSGSPVSTGVLFAQALGAPPTADDPPWFQWLTVPSRLVLFLLILTLVLGGGRRLLRGLRGRRAAARLNDPDPSPSDILLAADHGRAALPELFALLDPEVPLERRDAAGQALARLWARDELVAEEEKAIATRGFEVDWHARRRYPRALTAPIPLEARIRVRYLVAGSPGVQPAHLHWSQRIAGTMRASLEAWSPWQPGPAHARFTIEPGDFHGNGPHRLVLEARARTAGLTSEWQLDLPHVPFSFEFDPRLDLEAILGTPDAGRAPLVGRSILLEPGAGTAEPVLLPLNDRFVLRDPPTLVVTAPPVDLAHRLALEFEDLPGRFDAGSIQVLAHAPEVRVPIQLPGPVPEDLLDRPGDRRVRVHLHPDPARAWAHPDIRSIWPEPVVTDWVPARIVRR